MADPFNGNITAQELADMLPTGIVILNCRDEPVFSNQRFRELTTCHSAKSFGCWSKSIHPEDYSLVRPQQISIVCMRNIINFKAVMTPD
jgi:hypothetical protein